MALAVFGNIVTSWSWFGTNLLGVPASELVTETERANPSPEE